MELLYIIDKDNFNGSILNTIHPQEETNLNDMWVDYVPQTFEEYNEENGGNLIALNWEDFNEQYYKPHLQSLQKPFEQIDEKKWWDLLECVPPKKWHDLKPGVNVFFVGECYTASLYTCCLRIKHGKQYSYYSALRDIYTDDSVLLEQAKNLK